MAGLSTGAALSMLGDRGPGGGLIRRGAGAAEHAAVGRDGAHSTLVRKKRLSMSTKRIPGDSEVPNNDHGRETAPCRRSIAGYHYFARSGSTPQGCNRFTEAPMPRYFFHVHDGGSVPDDLGVNLPDIDAARSAAIELSCEILSSELIGPFQDHPSWRIEVSNSPELSSLPLFTLHFSVTQ